MPLKADGVISECLLASYGKGRNTIQRRHLWNPNISEIRNSSPSYCNRKWAFSLAAAEDTICIWRNPDVEV